MHITGMKQKAVGWSRGLEELSRLAPWEKYLDAVVRKGCYTRISVNCGFRFSYTRDVYPPHGVNRVTLRGLRSGVATLEFQLRLRLLRLAF